MNACQHRGYEKRIPPRKSPDDRNAHNPTFPEKQHKAEQPGIPFPAPEQLRQKQKNDKRQR
jgi:hypothetical protein